MVKRKREDGPEFPCTMCNNSYGYIYNLHRHEMKCHKVKRVSNAKHDTKTKSTAIEHVVMKLEPTKRMSSRVVVQSSSAKPVTVSASIASNAPELVKRKLVTPGKLRITTSATTPSTAPSSPIHSPRSPRPSSSVERMVVSPMSPRSTFKPAKIQIPAALQDSLRQQIISSWEQVGKSTSSSKLDSLIGDNHSKRRKSKSTILHQTASIGISNSDKTKNKLPEYINISNSKDIKLLGSIKCPFPHSEQKLTWYCEFCGSFHVLTSNIVICPFQKKHGFRVVDVPADGDCFYQCVHECLSTDPSLSNTRRTVSVGEMRSWVANQCGQEQFEFYQVQAAAAPDDTLFNFIRSSLDKQSPTKHKPSSTASSSSSSSSSIGTEQATVGAIHDDSHSSMVDSTSACKPTVHVNNTVHTPSVSRFASLTTLFASAEAAITSITNVLRTKSVNNTPTAKSTAVSLIPASVNPAPVMLVTPIHHVPVAPLIDLPLHRPSSTVEYITAVNSRSSPVSLPPQRPARNTRSRKDQSAAVTVNTVQELREYILREGSIVGPSVSMWADSFAFMVVGHMLKITILLIDMERQRGCLPYRYLHTCNTEEAHSVITNHLLQSRMKELSSPSMKSQINNTVDSSTGSTTANQERYIVLKRVGPAGHFQYIEDLSTGLACFTREKLPDVFSSLWGIS